MNNLEESTKIAKDVRFALLGRAIADRTAQGLDTSQERKEATILRRQEQDSARKATQFAALARQVGDAERNGKDIAELVAALIALRRTEVGPAVVAKEP
jgi:hypothetical protein